ncbi:hypothetical protein N7532_011666 [Penicillium argentinense]|uniref:Uncharacterized protein n=1 Tax=Penicillium argentinense TaxID=1131581 RepID=A0A9W9EIU3_9EURO|nr:uncharacterized protein N7532_011666 [Penicillium argentinense]KAJ5082623.1 hypothetical protein N7532_011666 [Penicillium argentinense]
MVALIDLWRAKETCKEIKNIKKPNSEIWTMRHGFFANMGGYLTVSKGQDLFPLTGDTLLILVENGLIDIPDTPENEIQDKGKYGNFVQSFALLQLLWRSIRLHVASVPVMLSHLFPSHKAFYVSRFSRLGCHGELDDRFDNLPS